MLCLAMIQDSVERMMVLHYQITVKEYLDDSWSTWFDGLTITHADDGTTTLAGPVRDQAQHFQLTCAEWLDERLGDQETMRPGGQSNQCPIDLLFSLSPSLLVWFREGREEPGDVVRRNPACLCCLEHRRHHRAFIDKAADESFWSGEQKRALKCE